MRVDNSVEVRVAWQYIVHINITLASVAWWNYVIRLMLYQPVKVVGSQSPYPVLHFRNIQFQKDKLYARH